MTDSLYDPSGQRKYLTPNERVTFLGAADETERETITFCHMLAHTGCRMWEALALSADGVDFREGVIAFETPKRRRKGVYRGVPVPPAILDMVHDLKAAQKRRNRKKGIYLSTFARNTAWRHVCAVMKAAGISGPHPTPKGLRHGFGIKGVTINTLQKWMGYAQHSATSIYADATGPEAKHQAEGVWG